MKLRSLLASLLLLAAFGASRASASEIPADLDARAAAVSALPSDVPADALDAVELAQLSQADPNQQGGDMGTLVLVGSVVAILVMMWIFTLCEAKN